MPNLRKGSAVVDVVISAAVIVFVLFPVFSITMEKYLLNNKAQIIKDSVDMTNLSAYNAINAETLGKNAVIVDNNEADNIYRMMLAKNLNLGDDFNPLPQSLAEGKVNIDSLVIYSEGFPAVCPNGIKINRPSIHSVISIPVRPSLYRQLLLNLVGKKYIELKIHVDSEIPVNN